MQIKTGSATWTFTYGYLCTTGPRLVITHIENEFFKSYAGKQVKIIEQTVSTSCHLLVVEFIRKGGENALFIALVPKTFFFVGLTTLGTSIESWLVGSLNWVSKLIVIYRRVNFVYRHSHWGCTSIYRPLSYSFRSLEIQNIMILRDMIEEDKLMHILKITENTHSLN